MTGTEIAQGPAGRADPLPVAPDTHSPAAGLLGAAGRCPQCAGAVRPDAPWCTQCWTDLRPAPPVAAPPAAQEVTTAPERTTDAATPPVARGLGGWPCSGCGTVNAVELHTCAACGTGFLAGLRKDEPPLLALPGVGDLTRLSRAQRLGLAAGVVLLVLVLVALLGLLTG